MLKRNMLKETLNLMFRAIIGTNHLYIDEGDFVKKYGYMSHGIWR